MATAEAREEQRLIVTDLHLQAMHCDVCKAVYEIPRRLMRDQHALLEMVEELKADHRECAENPGNPRLAAAGRMFRKRLELELARGAA